MEGQTKTVIRGLGIGTLFILIMLGMREPNQPNSYTYKFNSIHLADNLNPACKPDITSKDLYDILNLELNRLGFELTTKHPELIVDISLVLGNEEIKSYWQLNNHLRQSKKSECLDKIYQVEIIVSYANTRNKMFEKKIVESINKGSFISDLEESILTILTEFMPSYNGGFLN